MGLPQKDIAEQRKTTFEFGAVLFSYVMYVSCPIQGFRPPSRHAPDLILLAGIVWLLSHPPGFGKQTNWPL